MTLSGLGAVSQEVVAVGGFGYGVIGADIHVFGDGTPVYLLFEHGEQPRPDASWLRRQPSRMLDARASLVEFSGRDAELGELLAWRNAEEPRFAVRWLHGKEAKARPGWLSHWPVTPND